MVRARKNRLMGLRLAGQGGWSTEALERRVLLSGSLGGTAWDDVDGDGVRDEGEAALSGVQVYLDADNDAAFDPAEMSVITDDEGRYQFDGVPAGRHVVRQVVPAGYEQNFPGGAAPAVGATVEGIDFTENGSNNGGSYSIPPDPHGAAGPNHLVSVVNKSIQWHTKAGVRQRSLSLSAFFSRLAPQGGFDPKALYDQHAGRFLVVALERVEAAGATPNSARIFLAVSDDADPNGTWHMTAINAKVSIGGYETWVDYPGFGVDEEAVYVAGDMVNFGPRDTWRYQGHRLWIVAKEAFYAGRAPVITVHDAVTAAGLPGRQLLQVAHVYGDAPTGVGTFLVTTHRGGDDVDVIRVNSPLSSPSFVAQRIPMGDVSDVPAGDGYPGGQQRNSGHTVATNVGYTLNAVWRGGALYAAMHVLPTSGPDAGQTTVHWVKIDTSDLSDLRLADQGNVGGEELGAGTTTFMPSVAVDGAGNMAIGFSAANRSMYPGAYVTGRRADDPPGSVRPATALATGRDYYVRTFGGERNRWGDYSATVVDPVEDDTFWSFNEYALTRGDNLGDGEDGRWGTRWGRYTLPDATPGAHRVDLAAGQSVAGLHFASRRTTGSITGSLFDDLDGDGTRDDGEPALAGRTVFLDRNGNATPDPAGTAVQTVPAIEVPRSILDGGPTPGHGANSYYLFSTVSGTITDLNVRLNVAHPRASDLELTLVSQTGVRVPLLAGVGGTGRNFSNTTLDDEALTPIEAGTAPFNGSFRPQSPLSAFDGQPAAGTWRLEVDDKEAGMTGTLSAWSLVFTTVRPGETTVVTDQGGTYSFPGLPLGNHTIRQVLPEGWEQTAPAAAHGVALTAAAADATGRDFGSRLTQSPPAAVYVRGSSWTQGFKAYLESEGLGDDVYGYRVDNVTGSQRILPWVNLNEIILRYAAPPGAAGIPTPSTVVLDGDRPGGDYAVTAVNQLDPQTFALVLDRPLGGLSTGGENGVRVNLSVAGAAFRIDALQGDVDRSGSVVAADFSDVKNRFFRTTSAPGPAGPQQYTVFHDVDGSGTILANDFSLVKARFFDSLLTTPFPVSALSGSSITKDLFASGV